MKIKKDAVTVSGRETKINTVFAFISLFLGYGIIRAALFTDLGIGITFYAAVFVACGFIYMWLHKTDITGSLFIAPAIMLVFSVAFIISGIEWVRWLILLFQIVASLYWFLSAFGCRAQGKIGDLFPFEMLKAIIVQPFSSFFLLPRFVLSPIKSTKTGRKILNIVAGLALALIPGAVIVVTLMFADGAFENLVELIYKSFFWSLSANLLYFIIGLPAAMFIFGMMISSSSRKCKNLLTAEDCGRLMHTAGFISPAVIYTMLTAILAIYTLFFVSQSSYFLSAFAQIKPDGFTYADYARRGFFELCRLAAMNLFIVVLSQLFLRTETKQDKNKNDGKDEDKTVQGKVKQLKGIRVYNILMGSSTIALIAIAAAKLYLYIKNYGLTPARVNASWFLLLLNLILVFFIIRQITPRFNFWRSCTAAFIVLFFILAFSNTDTLIAKYNINRFYDGSLPSIDIELFYRLSDSALTELDLLLRKDAGSDGKLLENDLRNLANQYIKQRLSRAELAKSQSEVSITERINYILGFNFSRKTTDNLIKSGRYRT